MRSGGDRVRHPRRPDPGDERRRHPCSRLARRIEDPELWQRPRSRTTLIRSSVERLAPPAVRAPPARPRPGGSSRPARVHGERGPGARDRGRDGCPSRRPSFGRSCSASRRRRSSNARKHASATTIHVPIAGHEGGIRLVVTDDAGRGSTSARSNRPNPGHIGLPDDDRTCTARRRSLRYRERTGWRDPVTAWLPLAEPELGQRGSLSPLPRVVTFDARRYAPGSARARRPAATPAVASITPTADISARSR